MSDVIEEFDHEGFTAEVFYDGDVESPLEDMLTHVITPNGRGTRRYTIDDRGHELQAAHDELMERGMGMAFGRYVSIFHPEYMVKPCFMYDHSQVALSAETFVGRAQHARWDSAMIGWAIAPWAVEGWGAYDPDAVIDQELETLTQWMNGDTYRYTITDPHGDEVDSCGGFIGMEYVEEEVMNEMKWRALRAPKQLELELI